MIGGLGVCGLPYCCCKFLDDFGQVSIKMAKEQNLSLNSQKISGACGRLMCCLRYEHEVYEEEIKKTPKVDSIVDTPDGRGTVCEAVPLAGIVKVRFSDKDQQFVVRQYHRDSVNVIAAPKSKNSLTARSKRENKSIILSRLLFPIRNLYKDFVMQR